VTAWKFVLGPASGGHDLELTAAGARIVTWRLVGSHEASCAINGRHAQAASLVELATDLHVLRDGVILYRGRVGATSDALTDVAHVVTVPSVGYREILRRRLLYADSTLTWGSTDQSTIAWALVQDTQGRTGGNLGINRGIGAVTGRLRDRTYEAGQAIGDLIDNLAEVIDGFDWDIEPVSASAQNFNLYYSSRGQQRDVVLDYGWAVVSGTRTVTPSTYANVVRVSGAETTTAQTRQVADLATRPEGRWDAQFGDPDITVQAHLNEQADTELASGQNLVPAWTVKLKAGWWQGPSHVWIGDPVRLVVMSGRLTVDTSLRVFEIEAAIGKSGEESITMTLGAPRPDFPRRQRLLRRKLTDLERR